MTPDEIMKREIDKVLEDIIDIYEQSGRKVSGQFGQGLEAIYSENPSKAVIRGYTYLAGRGPTRKPGKPGEPTLRERIEDWIKQRGIKPIERNMKISSLSYLIARKIHRYGTDKSKWLRVYEQVLTPRRIDEIITKVGRIHVMDFIKRMQIEFQILEKNV